MRSALALVIGFAVLACPASAVTSTSARGPLIYGIHRNLLTMRDPISLAQVGYGLRLPGHADETAFSPDATRLAFSSDDNTHSSSVVTFVDLPRMRVIGRMLIREALGSLFWLRGDRLIGIGANKGPGGTTTAVLVDPGSRQVVRTMAIEGMPAVGQQSGVSNRQLVLLTQTGSDLSPVGISTIDTNGNIRSVTLSSIQGGDFQTNDGKCPVIVARDPALMVAPDAPRAYVVLPGDPIAEVDLTSMVVSYDRLRPALRARPDEFTSADAFGIALGHSAIAFTGDEYKVLLNCDTGGDYVRIGLVIANTQTWQARVQGDTAYPYFAGGNVIALRQNGVTGFALDGTLRFSRRIQGLNQGDLAFGVGRYLYIRSKAAAGKFVVDGKSGRLVGRSHYSGFLIAPGEVY